MIFSEIYGAYYNAVAEILKNAIDHPLRKDEIHRIVEAHAFGESIRNIEPALSEEKWQLICSDGTTPIREKLTMPMTLIQRRWLKAISLDPRIRLFQEELPDVGDVPPLFTPEDIHIFDQYSDGDAYTDEAYIKNFRLILDAIKNQYPLSIDADNHKGKRMHVCMLPKYLEYSEKDDKFRLFGSGHRFGETVNLGRIIKCERYTENYEATHFQRIPTRVRSVIFELVDERNALERVLLHFAHFEKQAEKIENHRFRVTVNYDKDDETEMVIRILSFGPMIRVIAPLHFKNLIKERLMKQKSCGQ